MYLKLQSCNVKKKDLKSRLNVFFWDFLSFRTVCCLHFDESEINCSIYAWEIFVNMYDGKYYEIGGEICKVVGCVLYWRLNWMYGWHLRRYLIAFFSDAFFSFLKTWKISMHVCEEENLS